MQIMTIPAFNDNYIWLLHQEGSQICAVVDPGDAAPVLERLNTLGYQLGYILITHHHHDHIGGVTTLLKHYPECQVFAGVDIPLPFDAHRVNDDTLVDLPPLDCSLTVMTTPGHTLSHVVYYNQQALFCGDTLFNQGCGRLFEGTPEQMLMSLNKIKALSSNPLVYSAHEYTLANLKFALAVEPDNHALHDYQKTMAKKRQQGLATVPFSLTEQNSLNPFLRCTEPQLQQSLSARLGENCMNELAAFTALRAWKDHF